MSKERLKQFKNSLDFLDDSADMSDYHRLIDTLENLYKDGELDWIHRFASKQSERVQELESIISQNESVVTAIVGEEVLHQEGIYETEMQKITKQNKRYRELINNINEKASLFGVDVPVYEAIQDAIKELEGDPHD